MKRIVKDDLKKERKEIKDIKHDKKDLKKDKVKRVMEEFKEKELHSGSKKGPKVTDRKQALAIAFDEARRTGKNKRKMQPAMII